MSWQNYACTPRYYNGCWHSAYQRLKQYTSKYFFQETPIHLVTFLKSSETKYTVSKNSSTRGLLSSGMLCRINWWLVTNILGQPLSRIFKGWVVQEEKFLGCLAFQDGTHRLSRNIGTELPSVLHNIPEQWIPHLHYGGSPTLCNYSTYSFPLLWAFRITFMLHQICCSHSNDYKTDVF